MSVSLNDLRAAQNKKLEQAQAEHAKATALLDAIPAASPAPDEIQTFGYCADASVVFVRQAGAGHLVEELLKLYPPLPLVDVVGAARTQKPVKYLRDQELHSAQWPIFPVVYKSGLDSVAQWWTTLPCGDVQVRVKNPLQWDGLSKDEQERYEHCVHGYSTGAAEFFTRKLAPVSGKPSPMVAWHTAWSKFSDAQGFNARQASFLNAIKARLERFLVPDEGASPDAAQFAELARQTLEDLPQPQYIRGGTAVAFGPGEDLVEGVQRLQKLQAERKPHWMDTLGDFWLSFDQEQAQALLAFAREQAQSLPGALEQDRAAEKDVQEALAQLLGPYAEFSQDSDVRLKQALNQYLVRKTGWELTVMNASIRGGKASAWVRFWHRSRGFEMRFDCDPKGRRLLPQDIAVEYA